MYADSTCTDHLHTGCTSAARPHQLGLDFLVPALLGGAIIYEVFQGALQLLVLLDQLLKVGGVVQHVHLLHLIGMQLPILIVNNLSISMS